MGSRLARWRGLVAIGWRRVHHRLGAGGGRQTLVSVIGVALPVALLLLVASVSLGLAVDPATSGEADYWVVPDGASSAVTTVDSAKLGGVHPTTQRVTARDDVVHASPMLIDFVKFAGADSAGSDAHVLVIGVIPAEDDSRIAPLPTDGLQSGDPYYGGGGYDGGWTGEAVLSESASQALGVEDGDELTVSGSDRSFTVVNVESPATAGLTQLPIAIVHLSELQALTGGTEADTADQLVVVAPDGTATTAEALGDLYPRTSVRTRGGLLTERGMDSRLPAAMSVAALLIALTTGTLLVSTAFGFELAADSQQRQVLSALGIGGRSRIGLIGTELTVVSLYGGALAVSGWAVGLFVINRLAMDRFGAPVAMFEPRFIGYGLVAALAIGLLSLPYLLIVDWRAGGEVSFR